MKDHDNVSIVISFIFVLGKGITLLNFWLLCQKYQKCYSCPDFLCFSEATDYSNWSLAAFFFFLMKN